MATKIILASSSPRRREILTMANIDFDVEVADIDETIDLNNDLRKEIEKLSYLKAKAVFSNRKDCIVIGSDTIVSIHNKVLGKPHDKNHAKEMLELLSNNTHEVITAVTILKDDNIETFSNVTKVTFYPLSENEIEEYINTNEPMDKAGAYAIQGIGAKFIKEVNGDYYTIVGLPIGELYHRLKKYIG